MIAEAARAAAVSPQLHTAETRSGTENFSTTLQVDLVDAHLQVDVIDVHFAPLNPIHYLLKVGVFDLQPITD